MIQLLSLYIQDYEQFNDLMLNFTDKEGKPIKKVCFLGKNGTGKSKILQIINEIASINFIEPIRSKESIQIIVKIPFFFYSIKFKGEVLTVVHSEKFDTHTIFLKKSPLINLNDWNSQIIESYVQETDKLKKNSRKLNNNNYIDTDNFDEFSIFSDHIKNIIKRNIYNEPTAEEVLLSEITSIRENSYSVFSPVDSPTNSGLGINDVPSTTLNDSISLFNEQSRNQVIAKDTIFTFWNYLMYNLQKNKKNREDYINKPENSNKTIKTLDKEIGYIDNEILINLSEIWTSILNQCGLHLNYSEAKEPVHLNDNLKAYIYVKGTDKQIKYNELSTGIRNYIFRIGHLFSLFYKQNKDGSIIVIDEPEESLHPEFLRNIVQKYEEAITKYSNTKEYQLFFATHNPFVVSQFNPEEKFILIWNEDLKIELCKGVRPIGDDANDIYTEEMQVESVMTEEGIKVFDLFTKKISELKNEKEEAKIKILRTEILSIQQKYNFPV